MTDEQALITFDKLTAMYNKKVDDDQKKFWVKELESLTEITAQKVIQGLKSNRLYEKTMPTIPQFINLYKQNSVVVHSEHDFCYVCYNRGHDLIEIKEMRGSEEYVYNMSCHCDFCDLGKDQKIDFTRKDGRRVYSEPISKYLSGINLEARIASNKDKRQRNSLRTKEKNDGRRMMYFKFISDNFK
jgi:hypothetical protein